MSRYPPPSCAAAAAPAMNPLRKVHDWLPALMIAVALLAGGINAASADLKVDRDRRILASATVKTGIAAAEAGRLRDAITILTPHAARNHAMANYVLGLIYLRDRGALAARPTASHRHFARAAAKGHVASIFEAAFQFERSIGTAWDMGRAIHLYQLAARANHLNAQYNLAVLLSHREAKRDDLQQAYFWAIAARNNAVRAGNDKMSDRRITQLIKAIRTRIPHQAAAQASSAAARLTDQPV